MLNEYQIDWKKAEEKQEEARKLRAEERELLRRENSEVGQQWLLRFLSQWAVLSGSTLTLLVTFAQANNFTAYPLFRISSVFLLISLITSALQIFIGGQSFHHAAKYLSGNTNRQNTWSAIYPYFIYIPIGTYIAGLTCAWFFVDANLRW